VGSCGSGFGYASATNERRRLAEVSDRSGLAGVQVVVRNQLANNIRVSNGCAVRSATNEATWRLERGGSKSKWVGVGG